MTTPLTTPYDPEVHLLPQLHRQLLQVGSQVNQLQTRLDQVADAAQANSAQLDALVGALLTPDGGHSTEPLAELATQMEATRDQVAQMHAALGMVATQEQLASLERALAGRELLTDVADSVKKLGRTQFKANTLGETRERQIETALAVAREVVLRREQAAERHSADERRRLEELRSTARGELAAELLPALDGIDLALGAGSALLTRQRQEIAAVQARFDAAQQAWAAAQATPAPAPPATPAPPPGLWTRVRHSLAGTIPDLPPAPVAPAAPPPPATAELELAPELIEATGAWLTGLELVRDRFAAVLAQEQIQPLPALGQSFDPRLHVAVETEPRSDAPPNTVVRVVRQGYRQRQRILRYAEVVVARPAQADLPTAPLSQEEKEQDEQR